MSTPLEASDPKPFLFRAIRNLLRSLPVLATAALLVVFALSFPPLLGEPIPEVSAQGQIGGQFGQIGQIGGQFGGQIGQFGGQIGQFGGQFGGQIGQIGGQFGGQIGQVGGLGGLGGNPGNPCTTSRPPVRLSVVQVPGTSESHIDVTVMPGFGNLLRIQFHGAPSASVPTPNAKFTVPTVPGFQTGEFDLVLSPGAPSVTFSLFAASANAPVTLPLDVVDSCGAWSTVVGGGVPVFSTSGPGTFGLEPAVSSVAVGDAQDYRFRWTVPEPGVWRNLSQLALRLRDASGVVLGIRWDESNDAFTVTDTRAPAAFSLDGARSENTGPTGQSVTLILRLRPHEPSANQVFTIEVSALDDFGQTAPFAPAGTVTVVPAVPPEQQDKSRKLTPQQQWQRDHSNAGSREDERLEGDILSVDCRPSPAIVMVGNRDGAVTVTLRGEAVRECGRIQPGQYLEFKGEKITELQFRADDVSAP